MGREDGREEIEVEGRDRGKHRCRCWSRSHVRCRRLEDNGIDFAPTETYRWATNNVTIDRVESLHLASGFPHAVASTPAGPDVSGRLFRF